MQVAEYLAKSAVEFELIPHAETCDAQRMAHSLHVPGRHVAKTVLLRSNDYEYAVAVLPATMDIDFDCAANALEVDSVVLASETEVAELCPNCEVGALPPFGSQMQMKTLCDERLLADDQIYFEGNTHHESIRLSSADYRNLEDPIVAMYSFETDR